MMKYVTKTKANTKLSFTARNLQLGIVRNVTQSGYTAANTVTGFGSSSFRIFFLELYAELAARPVTET